MHPRELRRAFDAWEARTRGFDVWPHRVPLEPPFEPILAASRVRQGYIDDGRRPGIFAMFTGRDEEPPAREIAGYLVPPAVDAPEELVELELLVPDAYAVRMGAARSCLGSLQVAAQSIAFEIVGLPSQVSMQLTCDAADEQTVTGAVRSYFPDVRLRERTIPLREEWDDLTGYAAVLQLGLRDRVFLPLRSDASLDTDPLLDIVTRLGRLRGDEFGLVQVLFSPASDAWGEELERFLSSVNDVDGTLPRVLAKFSGQVFAATIRVLAVAEDEDHAASLARDLAQALCGATRSDANELTLVDTPGPSFDVAVDDVLARATHTSGILLSLSELSTLVHPAAASIRSERFLRLRRRTKAVPAQFTRGALLLGQNECDGETRGVCLSVKDRLRHTYVIGASGTGKSTLLLSMVAQDIEAGNGFAVLDPHGDLVDDILARIPENRVQDVLVLDPADSEFPVGFNVLSAHSDLERTVLASDLVGTFKRLSTTFGDQMVSVLENAVLAFLESREGGTLLDLRRFLLDKAFRAKFLKTVADDDVIEYWEREFPLLKGAPQASILARLNAFLRPKVIRNMVAQKQDRLDMRAMMDQRRIILARLSHGAIGEENAHLLGSLLVGKITQAAMSRQDLRGEARVPFFLYVDEFHHFVTPSIATILSGTRKYGLGLVLAHQELRQIKSRSEDVLSSVGNAYTRVAFRVADHDAKQLADGFSSFQASDLQNLGMGEAIARIERPEFDFSLKTAPLDPMEPAKADVRRERVLAASRASFATSRAEVEAVLTRGRPPEQPSQEASPTGRRRKASAPSSDDSTIRSTTSDRATTLPGRGGAEHKYLQALVKKLGEERGFMVSLERDVLSGHGYVDAVLESGDITIGIEISVSSPPKHEAANLVKCLAAGCDFAVLVSTDERRLRGVRGLLAESDDERVRLLRPTELAAFLDQVHGSRPRVSNDRTAVKPTASRAKFGRLPASEAAAYIGIATQTLAKYRVAGESPPFIKVGRGVLYEIAELDRWLDERRRRSTSDEGPMRPSGRQGS